MIPMRDGKRLSAYVYFPKGVGADQKWPAIFEQRYADISSAGSRKNAAKFAEAGFVIALVNYRGTHESEGVYRGYRGLQWGELRDGYDVCEWLAAQPWCTGKVGTYGGSQAGYAQNYLAVTQPPHLVAQYMTDTGLSLFHEGYRIGGTTKPQRFIKGGAVARDIADNDALLREWDAHPDYDDYWRDEDASLHFDKMNLPCFTIGSWFDFMCQGSVASFVGRQTKGGPASRGHQQLVLGPWLHGGYPKSNKIGDLVFPENAQFDVLAHMVKWFNHFLKGEDNGIEKDRTVRYYVMGACGEKDAPGNVWREAKDWPPNTEGKQYHLSSDGKLVPGFGFEPKGGLFPIRRANDDGSKSTSSSSVPHLPLITPRKSASYASDPRQPMSLPFTGFPGAKDARPFEQQSEVRTWTTDPLSEPEEWTGEVTAEVFVSSTAKDTDFILRVSDVYPDGRSILLMDYPMRARYREGFDKQVLLTPTPADAPASRLLSKPEEIARLHWHIGFTSIIFNRGHRIRVTIASTGAPFYEPNNQTGGPQTVDWMKTTLPAINTIWHDAAHPSRIIVPLVNPAR